MPSDCKLGSHATAIGKKWWTYEVICDGALYDNLKSYVETVKAKIEREREYLPFSVVKMNVFLSLYSGERELQVKVKPNRRTVSGESYKFAVYDEDGNSKGGNIVSWNRPELNVKKQKSLSFLGITSDEFHAYSQFGVGDVGKFFSVRMESKVVNLLDDPLIDE